MLPTEQQKNLSSDGGVSSVASFSFPRHERLHLKREIETLFREGERLFVFPYRFTYRVFAVPEGGGVAMMPIVPKRLFKHAVDRNLNKRRLRAAFRLQVGELRTIAQQHQVMVHMSFLLISNEKVDYARLHAAVGRLLQQVALLVEKRAQKGLYRKDVDSPSL